MVKRIVAFPKVGTKEEQKSNEAAPAKSANELAVEGMQQSFTKCVEDLKALWALVWRQ